jgi:hypothetical protein
MEDHTLRLRQNDRLSKLHYILLAVVQDMAPEHHVLIEVPRVDERSWQTCLSDIVVDMVLSWARRHHFISYKAS